MSENSPNHPTPDVAQAQDMSRERGASLVEYAFLVALIAIVCITAVAFFGGESSNSLSTSGDSISAN